MLLMNDHCLYPKIGFLELTDITSETIPKSPGRRIM